jgi:hypothetical protein
VARRVSKLVFIPANDRVAAKAPFGPKKPTVSAGHRPPAAPKDKD